jgi:hypothetical protein
MHTPLMMKAARTPILLALMGAVMVKPIGRTLPPPQSGTTYYVAPRGNDSGSGSQSRPFRTIQHAADIVNPGDTVIVEDGTYTGTGAGTACASAISHPVVCLTRGGTIQQWITFRARHRLGAKIDGASNSSTAGFRFLVDANYITIEGFDVYGMGNATQSATGFELYDGGHDVILAENDIHHIGRLCTDTANGETGIFIQQPRVTVTRNFIHDIGRFAPGESGCTPSTIFYRNHDHGIYVNGKNVPGASDTLITNNVFYNHQRGWAIQVYPGNVNGLSILNNTFTTANPYNTGHIIIGASTRNGRIINNIFSDPLQAAVTFYQGAHSDLVIANNVSSVRLADRQPEGVTFMANVENAAPQIAPDTFRPLPASPALNHGMPLPEVSVDLVGTVRPQGGAWDIGALEIAGGKQ